MITTTSLSGYQDLATRSDLAILLKDYYVWGRPYPFLKIWKGRTSSWVLATRSDLAIL